MSVLKGIVVLFGILMIVAMFQQATQPPPKPKTPEEIAADAKDEAKLKLAIAGAKTLREAARNPDSFKLSQVLVMEDGAACITYRAQNGFGGMNIEYAVVSPAGKLVPYEVAGFTSMWNKECRGKTGDDKTWDVGFVADRLTSR